MKKFKFRLDSLLRYRSFQEHQKRLEVAAAHNDVMASQNRILEMEQAARSTGDTRDAILSCGMDSLQLQWFNNYLNGLSSLRVSEEAQHETLKQTLTRKQHELTEKAAARKAVENLKERRKEAYYREALRLEQQGIDELVILRGLDRGKK
jgi:flagellar protein FliJ